MQVGRWIVGPKAPLATLVLGGLVGVGFAVHLRSGAGLLIGAYLASALLLARAVVTRARNAPQVLGFGVNVVHGGTAVALPIFCFLALSGLREGGVFDVAWNRATAERSSSSTSVFWTSSSGGPAPVLRGRPAACMLPQDASSITRGLASFVRCADLGAPVLVSVMLTTSDAFCYTPFFKSATVGYNASLQIGSSSPTGTIHGTVSVTGSVHQTMSGIGSCRAFNEQIGREIGADLVAQINGFIAQH